MARGQILRTATSSFGKGLQHTLSLRVRGFDSTVKMPEHACTVYWVLTGLQENENFSGRAVALPFCIILGLIMRFHT